MRRRGRPKVGSFRLYLSRTTCLLIVVSMGFQIWPGIFRHPAGGEHRSGVVRSALGTVTRLSVLGFVYPLKMPPPVFFEWASKSLWVPS